MVNYQLNPKVLKLKPRDIIWMDMVEPKEQGPNLKNEVAKPYPRQWSRKICKSAIGQ